MVTPHQSRAVTALKIHCPVDEATFHLLSAGDIATIDPDCALARIIEIVRSDNPLGDFGLYKAVFELSTGREVFTPAADANPTLGTAGEPIASPTAILTVYIPDDVPQAAVSTALDAILAAHPWEVPVIEVRKTELLLRR